MSDPGGIVDMSHRLPVRHFRRESQPIRLLLSSRLLEPVKDVALRLLEDP